MIRYGTYTDLMDELVYKRLDYKGCRYAEHGWKALPADVQKAVIKNVREALLELDMGRTPTVLPMRTPDQPLTQPEGGAW